MKLSLFMILVELVMVKGQTCQFDATCKANRYRTYTLVGRPNGMFVSQQVTLSCPPNLSTQSGVIQVSWLLTNDTVDMLELNPGSDPSLEQDGYSLTVTNVTSEYEGIYYCKVTYAASNQPEVTAAAGCLYVAGRPFFESCAESETCTSTTSLQGEAGGSAEFDTRVDFRHGGSCGVTMNIRIMFLQRYLADGTTQSIYICSNLGSYRLNECSDQNRVSVVSQGDGKYNLNLKLQDLTAGDSGSYEVKVDLNDVFGVRTSIFKNFTLSVPEPPTVMTSPPPTTTVGMECSHEADTPILLLNGEEMLNGSTVNIDDIAQGGGAVMCVGTHLDATNAQFLRPDGSPVGKSSTDALYVSQGQRVVSLNHNKSVVFGDAGGIYCCEVPSTSVKMCLNISTDN